MDWSNTVFLAHASEDKHLVKQLYKELKENGLNPWLDEMNLMPGVRWNEEIESAIKKSRFFLACLSNNSITKDGYVQKELRLALSVMEQKSPNSVYFIPVLLQDVEIPAITVGTIKLSDYQTAKAYDEDGLRNLIDYLLKQVNLVKEIESHEKPYFDKIRNAISNGQTDTALRLLLEYIKKNENDYLNNITLISSRYNRLRNENVLGLISQESYAMESNKIVYSILEMIKYLENK